MDGPAITNRKIASLAPTWRTYRGVSVLFDNPGAPPPQRLEEATIAGIPEQRLYDDLTGLVAGDDLTAVRRTFGFCPLPRTTYHVTVCDGPNEDELAHAVGPAAAEVAKVVPYLPGSLPLVPAALRFAQVDALLGAVREHPVTMTAEDIVIWGSVLAARLRPHDARAQTALARIMEARQRTADALHAGLGQIVQPWRPHVSLGYFANLEAAAEAAVRLPAWNDRLAAVAPAPITFTSAGPYGFTDMVSFFRAPD